MDTQKIRHDPYAALKIKEFRFFVFARFITTVAFQMQSVIVGWQIYEMTKDPFSLGLIGLSEAIPFLSVALFAGHIADIFNRKKLIQLSILLFFICSLILLSFTYNLSNVLVLFGTTPIFIVIAITGLARAVIYPSQIALMSQIVPRELYPNSSTWNSTAWHIAAVTGPAIGGLIYGFFGITSAYLTVAILIIAGLALYFGIKSKAIPPKEKKETLMQSLSTGIRFVFRNQVVLGSLSLDMFAVLFGGALAMLPVFAAEVLHAGPQGLGFLRAAPAAGAVIMSMILAYYPPVKKAGTKLLSCVAGFGVCIILFAISKNFYLSLLLLAMSGIFDNVSYVLRQMIIQLYTPDNMRGRVAAVNSIFVGSSNEIGSFESGLAARIMGLIPSVIFGGSMTLLITGVTTKIAPALRKMDLREKIKEVG
jgi:MFS family permease